MFRLSKTTLIVVFLSGLIAARLDSAPSAAAPADVFVSVPPQASVVRAVGGPQVTVHCMVSAGQDPHLFVPTPKQVRALGRAKIFLTVGMPFEKPLLAKVHGQLPTMEIVDSVRGLARLPAPECCHDPKAGHDHDAGQSDGDPHVWLSPDGLRAIARNTADALAKVDPAHAADFRRRLKETLVSIDRMDAANRAKLAPYRGRAVYVFHPAFGYFCDAYGLRQKAVEMGGHAPSARHLRELARQAREDKAQVIFVQKQFDRRGAQIVADAIGGRLAEVDPLAEDAVENLGRIADAIVSGMSDK
ncbi:MAG TPA: zinc ABC transporter substrate-binding protein [Thermoguttaceae bacterium]|nr:zinc ABC transporter substrate-binding protein [Thermoguttaceae bacterium]